jgi:hypothetical protein
MQCQVEDGYLSEPSAQKFKTEGGLSAYMNFYPPKNKVCTVGTGAGWASITGMERLGQFVQCFGRLST